MVQRQKKKKKIKDRKKEWVRNPGIRIQSTFDKEPEQSSRIQ